jgi:hypothetical protein
LDVSGNGRAGTYQPGVSLGAPGAASIGGFSAEFEGTSGYVHLPDSWGGGPEATVEAWVNPSADTGNFQSIVSGHSPNAFVHFQLYTAGNTGAYTDAGFVALPIIPVEPLNEWRHVVLVAQSGESAIYVDGELLDFPLETEYGDILESSNVDIGIGHEGARWFSGRIDEVAIYDVALSEERIQAHYEAAFGPPKLDGDVNGDNLVNLLDFDIIRNNFRTGRLREQGDLTGDGRVDFQDFGVWKSLFQGPAPQGIPEPGSLTLAVSGLLLVLFARRRNNR